METPKPEPVPPVRIPEHGLPMTDVRKAAWIALDIASHGYMHNLGDPKKRALFETAVENYHRTCRDASVPVPPGDA